MQFFKNNYGFRVPYQLLIDGTFCLAALKEQVQLAEQLPKYFDCELKMLTTQCVFLEVEKLGPGLYGALQIIKRFNVHKCGHEKNPIGASQCLLSMLGSNNPGRYVIVSQDPALRDSARKVPGTPIMYLHYKAPTLEKPSDYSVDKANDDAKRIETRGIDRLRSLKEKEIGEESSIQKPRGKKRAKGPNPLSCMKKKKKTNASNPAKTNSDQSASSEKKKRKRVRIAQHVKEELAARQKLPQTTTSPN